MDLPEPTAWQWLDSGHMRKRIPDGSESDAWTPLYTGTQVQELLKAAKVAAFKEAAQQCDDRVNVSGHMASIAIEDERRAYWNGAATEAKVCGDRMRAILFDVELAREG